MKRANDGVARKGEKHRTKKGPAEAGPSFF
jgi:hypothetical protein